MGKINRNFYYEINFYYSQVKALLIKKLHFIYFSVLVDAAYRGSICKTLKLLSLESV